jgi:hypothetical protein
MTTWIAKSSMKFTWANVVLSMVYKAGFDLKKLGTHIGVLIYNDRSDIL